MSKNTFDYALIDNKGRLLDQGQIGNGVEQIRDWLGYLSQTHPSIIDNTLLCLEHSGYYSAKLLRFLHQNSQIDSWLESPLRIKRSIGIQRGKSDRLDAMRIASYCIDFQRYAKIWKPVPKSIERLGLLLSHRDRMVKYHMALRNTLEEETGFVDDDIHQEMQDITQPTLAQMESAIEDYNRRIEELLQSDVQLARQYQIIRSIPGFGPVIASKLIEITWGFTRLHEPRKLACFAGVAPFEHSSGTSIKGKTRISNLANKDIKKMRHLAALVTIRKGNIMHEYFNRKVDQGKHKMAVINAIRNKLIHILMACINNDTIYQKNYSHSLA